MTKVSEPAKASADGLTDARALDIARDAERDWGNARTYHPTAIIRAIHVAYAAGAAAAGDGRVPREPTDRMIYAGARSDTGTCRDIWRCMYDAAAKQPTGE